MKLPSNFIQTIEPVIIKAGSITLKSFRSPNLTIHYKGRSPVSQADLDCQAYLEEALHAVTPQASFYTEEGNRDYNDLVWIIDPIDGTKNFVHGMGMYAIGIALESAGKLIFSCVYNPVTKDIFWAQKDIGSFCNGKKVTATVPPHEKPYGILLYHSFPQKNNWDYVSKIQTKIKKIFPALGFRACGSALLAGCQTVIDHNSIFISKHLAWWDIAPVVCFAEQAGVTITQADTSPMQKNHTTCIIAHPHLYPYIQSIIQDVLHKA